MSSRILILALALSVGQVTLASEPIPLEPVHEEFHYNWRLTNLLGRIAGLFFPSHGEGVLSFESGRNASLTSKLEITSRETKSDEFWLYGAEIDRRQMQTTRAWSAYKYGDKNKRKEEKVAERGAVDVASGIYRIRQDPPNKPLSMRIWSDGKIYSVKVIPRGVDTVQVAGKSVAARVYSIRGDDDPVGGNEWKGEIDLWLARDERSTPVRIFIKRSGIGVRMELQP